MEKINITLDCDEKLKNKAKFVFESFFDALKIKYQFSNRRGKIGLNILYTNKNKANDKNYLIIRQSEKTSNYFEKYESYNPPDINWISYENKKIPILFYDKKQADIDFSSNIIHQDIIMSAFFFMSRWEEQNMVKEGNHFRFRFKDTLYSKIGFSPWADYYLKILEKYIKKEYPLYERRTKFQLLLTHDIDTVYKGKIGATYMFLKNVWERLLKLELLELPTYLITSLQKIISTRNFNWTFEKMNEIGKTYGINSIYFFISAVGRKKKLDYSFDDKNIINLTKWLSSQGHEVQLHGNVGIASSMEDYKKQIANIEKLGFSVTKNRTHGLRYFPKITPEIEEKLFDFNFTMGFAEKEGWRSGFSFPIKIYNIEEDKPFNIRSVPLVIMDCTFSKYQNIRVKDTWQKIKPLLDYSLLNKSPMCILWHNTFFDDVSYPGQADLYEKIVSYCNRHEKEASK